MRILVLLNPHAKLNAATAGHGLEEQCRDLFGRNRDDVTVRVVDPDKLEQAAREAIDEGFDCIVAGGGDGSVSTVAGALAGSDATLGVLPMGTLNHFARDLKLPAALDQAAGVITAGKTRRVDVGEVNGRVFINNASIGIYPHVITHRDRQMQRLGRGKWSAMLLAMIAAMRRFPTVRVRVGVHEQSHLQTTPFVFVGNNAYTINLLQLGERSRIDAGELCLYFTGRTGRLGLLRLALRALIGRLNQDSDFRAMTATELWVESAKRELRIGIDGEVVPLTPPLHFVSRPRALKVLVDQWTDSTDE
jgi:diacylglycerol kinase family enzyme